MTSKVHKARLQLAERILDEARRRAVLLSKKKPKLRTDIKFKNPPEPPEINRLNISQDARDALERARGSTQYRKDNAVNNPRDPLTRYAKGAEEADWRDATDILAKEFIGNKK